MVRRTLEIYECDKCGKDGKRYTLLFEDGALVMDRCEQHGRALEKMRQEKGDWREARPGRSSFHKSTPDELRRAMIDGASS